MRTRIRLVVPCGYCATVWASEHTKACEESRKDYSYAAERCVNDGDGCGETGCEVCNPDGWKAKG